MHFFLIWIKCRIYFYESTNIWKYGFLGSFYYILSCFLGKDSEETVRYIWVNIFLLVYICIKIHKKKFFLFFCDVTSAWHLRKWSSKKNGVHDAERSCYLKNKKIFFGKSLNLKQETDFEFFSKKLIRNKMVALGRKKP